MATDRHQAGLFDQEEEMDIEPFDESDEREIEEQWEELHTSIADSDHPTLAPEPVFSTVLKAAIDPDDTVLQDYATYVAPQLSLLLGHKTAKGGDFVTLRLAEGLTEADVARYSDDQSMRAHLINGLLPVSRVARTLKRWGFKRFVDDFDETTYRLFCAGFTLHDWLKLPDVDEKLQKVGLQHHTVNAGVDLEVVENIFRVWCVDLGLDRFLAPLGPLDTFLHDLILVASNTQLLWGTMRNLSMLPGVQTRRPRRTILATDLATLADYITYLGRTPVDVVQNKTIRRMIERFSDETSQAILSYHHVADVRGVLTNIINNVAMDAYSIADIREPLLYAPTGVVYLSKKDAPPAPDVATIADRVVERISSLCRTRLENNLTGFERDGKGLKYAGYYDLFFTPQQLASVVPRAAEKRILKNPAAGKRYASIAGKQMADPESVQDLPEVLEVDRIAEGCALLAKIAATYAPDCDAEGVLLQEMGLSDIRPTFQLIATNKTAGGVPYGWYYAAGMYLSRHPGLDENQWNERLQQLARVLRVHLPDESETSTSGWDEIRRYVIEHVRFTESEDTTDVVARAQLELERYSTARKMGQGSTNVCSLCSLPYGIDKQQEAAILFAPQVYTNKQPLHGSKVIRHICAVCRIEMMLRQLLMKRGRDSGNNFEKRKLRYLFFYPTYFFTPETLKMLGLIQNQLKRMSFTTFRKAVMPDSHNETIAVDLSPAMFQHLRDLMLDPVLLEHPENDSLFRLHYSDTEPVTFSFVGIPPASRDAKDAEAWVHPAFLALVLPMILDVKVVASESMLPIFNEANELPETVMFDGAHAAVEHLVQARRLNLDQVTHALQRLVASYLVHLEGNSRTGAQGFDYRWSDIAALARNIATSPLYAFHYLKKGLRREGSDSISGYKAALFVHLVEHYIQGKGDRSMSHARTLTMLYRQFYRHKRGRLNTNTILRPISEAAHALLEADQRLFHDDESLREVVQGRLERFIENVDKDKADGSIPKWIDAATRQQCLEEFSRYFVETIYRDVFGCNRAALAGKQLNLFKNACESIYMAEQRREWNERQEASESTTD